VTDPNEGPTVRDIYRTLSVEQKLLLESMVRGIRAHPLTEDQISLFNHFLTECSLGSMRKGLRHGKKSPGDILGG
jgi:hypothetical protein